MASKISVVINTLNEEKNIEQAVKSVEWADEIIVCDMYSDDKTVKIAKDLGAKVVFYEKAGYVEPARNFAIFKATSEWILILDADEQILGSLADKLKEISSMMKQIDYVRVPRKNLIFNHFMKASMWWPDYNIRFFKKGKVKWGREIHRPPEVLGQGLDLPAEEKYAIVHHNYESVSQFLERMDRYTGVQAEELRKSGYKFVWTDILQKPLSEFLSRFFAGSGYKDGLHGLALSLLQAFSFMIVYLKLWEKEKFAEKDIDLKSIKEQKNSYGKEIDYWIKRSIQPNNFFKRFFNN